VFYDKQPKYNPQMRLAEPYNKGVRKEQTDDDVYGSFNQVEVKNDTGLRYPRSVQYFKTAEHEGGFHKSQKPIALLEYLIKTYSLENDRVLDFTMGSCSTGVACINTNRKFIGIEKEQKYYNISVNRVQELLNE
jgi:site-specific DNA-methyltransferase (adenine-specific)